MAKQVIGDLTGKRFGKLLVLAHSDPIKSKIVMVDKNGKPMLNDDGTPKYRDGKVSYRAWLVRCDCGNELAVKESILKNDGRYIASCGCTKEINPQYVQKGISKEELEFQELYDFVHDEIMKYPKGMLLSQYMILRLKGMHTGQYLRNKKAKEKACYPYPVILNAFRASSVQIQNALFGKSFIDEERKFAYICAIVDKNINSVFVRMQNQLIAKEQAKHIDLSVHATKGHNYTPVTKKSNGDWLKEMQERKKALDDMLYDEDDEEPLDIESLK